MGLSSLVYPGANHTRFEHALGSMYVMQKAIDVLILKGIENHDYDSVHYFVFNGSISNQTYISDESQILILDKKNCVYPIADAMIYRDFNQFSTPLIKFYLCYPKQYCSL